MTRRLLARARGSLRRPREWLARQVGRVPPEVRGAVRPVALRVFAIAGALAALYLAAANVLVMTPLLKKLVNAEESIQIQYEGAYSLWPGRVHVEKLVLRSEDYNVQFQVSIERGVVDVSLLDFFERRFRARSVKGEGVSFRMRHKVRAVGRDAERLRAYPPIEGYDDPPLYSGPEPPPIPEDQYELWEIWLDEVEAEAREIWILEHRLSGVLRVTGGFRLRPVRWFEVSPAELEIDSGTLSVAGVPYARTTKGVLSVEVPRTDVEHVTGLAVLASLDARLELTGRDGALRFADVYLRPHADSTLRGELEFDAKLSVEQGKFVETSSIALVARNAALRHEDERLTAALLEARVEATEDGALAARLQAPELEAEVGEQARQLLELSKLELGVRLRPASIAESPSPVGYSARVERFRVEELGRLMDPLARRGVKLRLAGAVSGALDAELSEAQAPKIVAEARLTGAEVATAKFGVAASGRAKLGLEPSGADPKLGVGTLLFDAPVLRLVHDGEATDRFGLELRSRDLAYRHDPERLSASLAIQGDRAESLLSLAIGADVLRKLTGAVLGIDRLSATAHFRRDAQGTRVELERLESGAVSARGYVASPKQGETSGALLFRTDLANVGLAIEKGETEVSPLVSDDWLPDGWRKLSRAPRSSDEPRGAAAIR